MANYLIQRFIKRARSTTKTRANCQSLESESTIVNFRVVARDKLMLHEHTFWLVDFPKPSPVEEFGFLYIILQSSLN